LKWKDGETMEKFIEDILAKLIVASVPVAIFLGLIAIAGSTLGVQSLDVQSELERTDNIISIIEENLPETYIDVVGEQLQVANEMQENAWSSYDNSDVMIALHMTMQARELAQRIEKLMDKKPPSDDPVNAPVLRVLENNAELIEDISSLYGDIENSATTDRLQQLMDMQNQAWDAYEDGLYELAGDLGYTVRENLIKLRGLVSMGQNLLEQEQISAEIEKVEDFIIRAEEQIGTGSEQTDDLISYARDLLDEAKELYQQGYYQQVYRVLDNIYPLVQKAMNQTNDNKLHRNEISKHLDRCEKKIEDGTARVEITGKDEAMELIDQAVGLYNQAELAFEDGYLSQVEGLIEESEKMVDLAIQMSENDHTLLVESNKALEHTEIVLQDAIARIEETGNTEAISIIHQAEEFQNEASKNRDNGNYKEALTYTRTAMEFAQKALNLIE